MQQVVLPCEEHGPSAVRPSEPDHQDLGDARHGVGVEGGRVRGGALGHGGGRVRQDVGSYKLE